MEVASGMWIIADKYDVPALRYQIASPLVSRLNHYFPDRPKVDLQKFPAKFQAIYELTHSAFHESPAMDDLETRMVKLLVVFKLQKYDAEARTGLSILAGTEDESSDTGGTPLQEFQVKITTYMNENGSFARKYAQGMEIMMNKAFKHYELSKSRLEDLRPSLIKQW